VNIESSAVADFGGHGDHNDIIDIHLESLLGDGAVYFDITGGDGWVFDNVWFSNPQNLGTLFRFNVTDGSLTGYPDFQLRRVRCNGNSTLFKMVNDVPRGISRTSAQFNRTIHEIISGSYNFGNNLTPNGWQVEIAGTGSGADGLGVGTGYELPPLFANGIAFSRNGALGGNLFGGSGAPSGFGMPGDFYLRTDTPTVANQRLYVRNSTSWVGIV
jgi:hypothetical protein